MKLYNVPRNTRIRTLTEEKLELDFHHIDGAYSYCKDEEGNVWHIAAWTEVEIVESKE